MSDDKSAGKPKVLLPGGTPSVSISESAREISRAINSGTTPTLFRRVSIVTIEDGQFVPMSDARFTSFAEQYATLVVNHSAGGVTEIREKVMPKGVASSLLSCDSFLVPNIASVRNAPIIVDRNGRAEIVTGYCPELETFCFGNEPPTMSLTKAVELLKWVVNEFHFATAADHSRAIAAMLSPAMLYGHHISDRRVPMDRAEADKSQAGKGIRHQIIAAIYAEQMGQVVKESRGVQNWHSAFDQHVIAGKSMIQVDNVRGEFASERLESFLTESSYTARAAYSREVTIDPRGTMVFVTTNGAQLSVDLCNRASMVRIKKREGHAFRDYEEGSVVRHVQAHRPKFLAAVFAVITEWIANGSQGTQTREHDFRTWAQSMDWIVQNIFKLSPLLDGHILATRRAASETETWVRQVCIEIQKAELLDQPLRSSQILGVLESTNVEIPGYAEELENQSRAMRAIGKRFKNAVIEDIAHFDDFIVERQLMADDMSRQKTAYVFRSTPSI